MDEFKYIVLKKGIDAKKVVLKNRGVVLKRLS